MTSIELRRVHDRLQGIFGRETRWSGVLRIESLRGANGIKTFGCDIVLSPEIVASPLAWRTALHESIHAFSAGFNALDYSQNVGWEEGVVELLQREFRSEVLGSSEIDYDEEKAALYEIEQSYNGYVNALRDFAVALGTTPRILGVHLLSVPIRDRSQAATALALRSPRPGALTASGRLKIVLGRLPL